MLTDETKAVFAWELAVRDNGKIPIGCNGCGAPATGWFAGYPWCERCRDEQRADSFGEMAA